MIREWFPNVIVLELQILDRNSQLSVRGKIIEWTRKYATRMTNSNIILYKEFEYKEAKGE